MEHTSVQDMIVNFSAALHDKCGPEPAQSNEANTEDTNVLSLGKDMKLMDILLKGGLHKGCTMSIISAIPNFHTVMVRQIAAALAYSKKRVLLVTGAKDHCEVAECIASCATSMFTNAPIPVVKLLANEKLVAEEKEALDTVTAVLEQNLDIISILPASLTKSALDTIIDNGKYDAVMFDDFASLQASLRADGSYMVACTLRGIATRHHTAVVYGAAVANTKRAVIDWGRHADDTFAIQPIIEIGPDNRTTVTARHPILRFMSSRRSINAPAKFRICALYDYQRFTDA